MLRAVENVVATEACEHVRRIQPRTGSPHRATCTYLRV